MVPIPAIKECLSKDLGLESCQQWLDPSVTESEAAGSLLARDLLRKFSSTDRPPKSLCDLALEKFLFMNNHAKELVIELNTSGDEELFGMFKDELWKFFNPQGYPLIDSLDQIFMSGRVGPGAGIGSPHGSAYAKLWASKLSYHQPVLKKHFENRTNLFPLWRSAETARSAAQGGGLVVEGSRLSFVSKNDSVARTICVEPVLNMFYQLGIGSIIESRLRTYFGINLSTQPDRNRALAKAGSKDGSVCTIDLESASDAMSLRLLELCLPREVLTMLRVCRSPKTLIHGEWHELHMVSSMGNGFTFPLQTCLFACAVRSVYRSLGIHEKIEVFGDDIICVKQAYNRLTKFLSLLGFFVNKTKSFSEGPFRESCGHDYFKGRNVRSVFVKALRNPADLHVAINRLIDWSVDQRIPLFNTTRLLLGSVRRLLLVPGEADASSGIRVTRSVAREFGLKADIHGTITYHGLEWVPRRVDIQRSRKTPEGKKLFVNPDGLLMSVLYGESVVHSLVSRDIGRWKTKRRRSPCWDVAYESVSTTAYRSAYVSTLLEERNPNKV